LPACQSRWSRFRHVCTWHMASVSRAAKTLAAPQRSSGHQCCTQIRSDSSGGVQEHCDDHRRWPCGDGVLATQESKQGNKRAGWASIHVAAPIDVVILFYTEVPLPLRGRGYGYHLVCGALQRGRFRFSQPGPAVTCRVSLPRSRRPAERPLGSVRESPTSSPRPSSATRNIACPLLR
jgi:hypothetical protein